MERESPLHERLLSAVERAARVQKDSYALIERQHALIAELRESVAVVRRRRGG